MSIFHNLVIVEIINIAALIRTRRPFVTVFQPFLLIMIVKVTQVGHMWLCTCPVDIKYLKLMKFKKKSNINNILHETLLIYLM